MSERRCASTGFTSPSAANILTDSQSIFNSFTGLLELVIGLSFGVALLGIVTGLFKF